MALKPTSRRPIGKQAVTPPRRAKAALPADALDPRIAQAKKDLDAGQVDTDMHATPGLDAQRRARLVPGAGGQPLVVLPWSMYVV